MKISNRNIFYRIAFYFEHKYPDHFTLCDMLGNLFKILILSPALLVLVIVGLGIWAGERIAKVIFLKWFEAHFSNQSINTWRIWKPLIAAKKRLCPQITVIKPLPSQPKNTFADDEESDGQD